MKSVFDTSPPSFAKNEAGLLLKKKFKIFGELQELYSDRDQIFFVKNIENEFILKISNAAEDYKVIDLQDEAAKYIYRKDPRMNIPLRVGSIHTAKKNNEVFFIRLLRYVRGTLMSEIDIDNNTCRRMGTYMGRLSNNLVGFEHPGAYRTFDWDVKQIDLIKKKIKYIKSSNDRSTVHHFIDEFETHITPVLGKLNQSIIHNDGNDHNIILDKNSNPAGIIDFGDMIYSYKSAEPAVCMAYVALKVRDIQPSISLVLKHYNAVHTLNEFELKAVIYLLCLRLCITVSMASWRKKLFPNNAYLSTSEASAWRILRMMEKEDLENWSDALHENAL